MNLLPLQYKTITPEEKFITNQNNPPEMIVEFFNEQENLNLINCFSNEGNKWDKSEIKLDKKKLVVKFREKFLFRRGRINCSKKNYRKSNVKFK